MEEEKDYCNNTMLVVIKGILCLHMFSKEFLNLLFKASNEYYFTKKNWKFFKLFIFTCPEFSLLFCFNHYPLALKLKCIHCRKCAIHNWEYCIKYIFSLLAPAQLNLIKKSCTWLYDLVVFLPATAHVLMFRSWM